MDLSNAIDRAKSDCGPNHPEILFREAQLASHQGRSEDALSALSRVSPDDLPNSLVAPFHELFGKTNDRLGQFSQAFSAFQSMNEHVIETQPGATRLAEGFSGNLQSLQRAWASVPAAAHASYPAPDTHRRHAFLIGFPRSGTTLLDTLLRGHPEIDVVEEKPLVGAMA